MLKDHDENLGNFLYFAEVRLHVLVVNFEQHVQNLDGNVNVDLRCAAAVLRPQGSNVAFESVINQVVDVLQKDMGFVVLGFHFNY